MNLRQSVKHLGAKEQFLLCHACALRTWLNKWKWALSMYRDTQQKRHMYIADNDDITMGQCFNEVLLCTHMKRGVVETLRLGWVPYANYFLDFSGVQAFFLSVLIFFMNFLLSYSLLCSIR